MPATWRVLQLQAGQNNCLPLDALQCCLKSFCTPVNQLLLTRLRSPCHMHDAGEKARDESSTYCTRATP